MKNQEELLIHLWNKIESDFESIERKLDRKIKIKNIVRSLCTVRLHCSTNHSTLQTL